MWRGGGGAFGTAYLTGGVIAIDNGAVGTPSLSFASDPTTGWYRSGADQWALAIGGNSGFQYAVASLKVAANYIISWSQTTNNATATADTTLARQAAGRVVVMGGVATPAGGSANLGLVFGTTAGFGIYIGSGLPTLSAAQGSIYLRSDGSSTSTRLYVNTNGTTGWTNVTTAT